MHKWHNLIVNKIWKEKTIINYSLYPVSLLFQGISFVRRKAYQQGLFSSKKFSVPIVIVGNIACGGTGKTPLVIYLAQFLKQQGYCPGIISRGYKGNPENYPLVVTKESSFKKVGDEPLLMAKHLDCPIIVDPNRVQGVNFLLHHYACNIVISDDGLQHYALRRDIEIAMVNHYQNGFCMPAGPLRESFKRLNSVDLIVNTGNMPVNANEIKMDLIPHSFIDVTRPEREVALDYFFNKPCHAVAAIANPVRFFDVLKSLPINFTPHAFPDHYSFKAEDFDFKDNLPILMTEKDAIKCNFLNLKDSWYLKVDYKNNDLFNQAILSLLQQTF